MSDELLRLRRENQRLRELLAEHGIEIPSLADDRTPPPVAKSSPALAPEEKISLFRKRATAFSSMTSSCHIPISGRSFPQFYASRRDVARSASGARAHARTILGLAETQMADEFSLAAVTYLTIQSRCT